MKRIDNPIERKCERAFTVIELLVMMAVLALVAALLLPNFGSKPKRNLAVIRCLNNLKQIAVAEYLWSGDNGDKFPVQYFTNRSGGPLFADATNGFRYFQVMSNELNTPKILVCPSDGARTVATNFGVGLDNNHVSYFLGLDAVARGPDMLVAGDRNLTNDTPVKNSVLTLTTKKPARWTSELHNSSGNIALSDGSAQLTNKFPNPSGTNVIRLLMP